jgi:predicted Zn-dependent protease
MVATQEDVSAIAEQGLEEVRRLDGVRDAEIFAASNGIYTTKVNYTSDIPCNGVEQPSASASAGVGVRLFRHDGHYGFGFESALSVDAAVQAAIKARESAYVNPFMNALPVPPRDGPLLANYHDPKILNQGGIAAIDAGWHMLDGLVGVFEKAGYIPADQIVANGDITTIQEVMAIASSTGLSVTDVSTVMIAYLTTMAQRRGGKGTGWAAGSTLESFRPEDAGAMAAESTIQTVNGTRIDSGTYDVVLGPQAVNDLVHHFLIPAVTADYLASGNSPFNGQFGQEVVSPLLTMYDDAAVPGLAGSKAYTCEGLPTGRTVLIDSGRFVGFLSTQANAALWASDSVDARVAEFQDTLQKFLGASTIPRLSGRNGFRFGSGGGRVYMAEPSAHATNLFIQGANPVDEEELLRKLGDGIYIGRLWYTYPIGGLAKGDVTSTVIADSYIVRDGVRVQALKPNTVRLRDNVVTMFKNVVNTGTISRPTIVWGSEAIVHTPQLRILNVHLENIADFMDSR